MSRPVYERLTDQIRQGEIITRLEHAVGMRASATPRLCGWDYEMLRNDGTLSALVEVKYRRNTMQHYPTYIISQAKIVGMAQAARERNCMAGLLVGWTDCIGWLRVDNRKRNAWPVVRGGRTDRNDPADIESVYEIPTEYFRIIY
jgi:hypothetical protein